MPPSDQRRYGCTDVRVVVSRPVDEPTFQSPSPRLRDTTTPATAFAQPRVDAHVGRPEVPVIARAGDRSPPNACWSARTLRQDRMGPPRTPARAPGSFAVSPPPAARITRSRALPVRPPKGLTT